MILYMDNVIFNYILIDIVKKIQYQLSKIIDIVIFYCFGCNLIKKGELNYENKTSHKTTE